MLALTVTGSLSFAEPPLVINTPARACVRTSTPIASLDDVAPISRRRALLSAAAAAATVPVLPALAESTLVTRQQAYTRYVPRIERGRDFWATGLRKQIQTSDWSAIQQALEPVGKNKGGAISKVFGPMRLWASSWSSKTVSDKTLAMEEAVDELSQAASTLQIAADGKVKEEGFLSFLGGKKAMDESKRQDLAKAAYKKGVIAFNKYIEIGNDGLGLQFAAIDTID